MLTDPTHLTLEQFVERRVLPMVCAFACGVLAMDMAHDRRDLAALAEEVTQRVAAEVAAHIVRTDTCPAQGPRVVLVQGQEVTP